MTGKCVKIREEGFWRARYDRVMSEAAKMEEVKQLGARGMEAVKVYLSRYGFR